MREQRSGMTVRGYAKINLHLDITGRLEGGYHSVQTVMQTVSLFDTVTVCLVDEAVFEATCDREGVPADDRNIAVRAARMFAGRVKSDKGARIHIEKRIPMAAGLAGGSADAAATLRAMNALYDDPLTEEELCELGDKLGADVPFCIVGGTCYAEGKGERLQALPSFPDCVMVVACGGEGVSTPWGFGLLDQKYADFGEASSYRPRDVMAIRSALEAKDLSAVCQSLYNIFEEPVLECRPVAASIRACMLSCGAMGAMMSGSGPSVFGIFASVTDAERAVEQIQASGSFATLCRPKGRENAGDAGDARDAVSYLS